MRAVLGIDAAWTGHKASGVALAVETTGGWRLAVAEPSYERFVERSFSTPHAEPEDQRGGLFPGASALLEAAKNYCGVTPSLVAVDMPLSLTQITGRRASDNAVSKAYGGRKCGTHTPNPDRPGPVSEGLRRSFESVGYLLHTSEPLGCGVIEVYPHPALVELAEAGERFKYKVEKTRSYWPSLTPAERRHQLRQEWSKIVGLLDRELEGVSVQFDGFELQTSRREMKAIEDALDAVVCAWVAICALNGRAKPFGDRDSAIWIPCLNPS